MKKTIIAAMLFIGLQGSAMAQGGTSEQDYRGHRFSVGVSTNYKTSKKRVGLGGEFKWLLPTQHDRYYRFLVTAKATHTPPGEGGFFKMFDGGEYDNITALYLMAGYRIGLGDNIKNSLRTPGDNTWYVELNAGLAYVHHYPVTGFAFNPKIGYTLPGQVDIYGGFQGVIGGSPKNMALIELGVAYSF